MKRLEELTAEGNLTLQMVLPIAGSMGRLRKGVGELIRQAGLHDWILMAPAGADDTAPFSEPSSKTTFSAEPVTQGRREFFHRLGTGHDSGFMVGQ